MQGVDRSRRVGQQIRKELAAIIASDYSGEGLGILSITAVRLSKDLRHARIFVTALGARDNDQWVVGFLKAHASELRHELSQRTNLRRTPDLAFEYDESIAYGAKMSRLLNQIQSDEGGADGT
ncbi:MAG: 30S ribosome-binding factor RbfA [Candidatus Thioglobus sp.]|nr:MAG: 30S ribosome-binding factor RbfA [Candidatus Thioglobus sp.]